MKERVLQKRYFTDKELETMIMGVAKGQRVFHETDVDKLYDWILRANVDKGIADMVLEGKLSVDTTGGEFRFQKIKE
jgi:hypothetical protein